MPTPDLGMGSATFALLSPQGQDPRTHVPFPPGQPKFLIPRHPAAAAATAVRTSTTPGSWRSRMLRSTGQVLARLGVARLAPHAVALGGPGTFLHHLEEVMGQNLIASVHLGPPRANRKPVLHLMDRRGRSVAFAKLGINDLTFRRVRNEASALRRLADTTMPDLIVPSLLDSGQWQGLDYLVMRPVATDSGLTSTRELRGRALRTLVGAFPAAETPLEQSPWWLRTMVDLDTCGHGPDVTFLKSAAARVLERFGSTPVLRGAGHGDFSPWNVCAYPEHLVVWDWERFALDVPVGWDEIHFTLNAHPGGAAGALTTQGAVGQHVLKGDLASSGALLVMTYLLNRGVNYLVDRQLEAGASHGPLSTWLLPALDELLDTGCAV